MPKVCPESFPIFSQPINSIHTFPDRFQPHKALAMNMSKTPIVCGICNTINYRASELTCKKCNAYFPTRMLDLPQKKLFDKDLFITAAVGTVIASIVGTTAAAVTFAIASVL